MSPEKQLGWWVVLFILLNNIKSFLMGHHLPWDMQSILLCIVDMKGKIRIYVLLFSVCLNSFLNISHTVDYIYSYLAIPWAPSGGTDSAWIWLFDGLSTHPKLFRAMLCPRYIGVQNEQNIFHQWWSHGCGADKQGSICRGVVRLTPSGFFNPQVFIDPHWFSQKYIADLKLVHHKSSPADKQNWEGVSSSAPLAGYAQLFSVWCRCVESHYSNIVHMLNHIWSLSRSCLCLHLSSYSAWCAILVISYIFPRSRPDTRSILWILAKS